MQIRSSDSAWLGIDSELHFTIRLGINLASLALARTRLYSPRPPTWRPVRRPQVGFHRASSSYLPHISQVIPNTPPPRQISSSLPSSRTLTLQWTRRMELGTDSMPGVPEEIMQLSGSELFLSDSSLEASERRNFNPCISSFGRPACLLLFPPSLLHLHMN